MIKILKSAFLKAIVLVLAVATSGGAVVHAQDASSGIATYCDSSISAADCEMSKRVATRIAAEVTLEHTLHTWPPDLYIHDQQDEYGNSLLNAFAHACGGDIDDGMPQDCTAPEGSTKPHVHFTKQILDQVIMGDEDRLALIMGHEMGHIVLGHTTPYAYRNYGQSEISLFAFGRQQEIGSDIIGTELGLAAGYDLEGMLGAFYKFIDLDLSYSSFEGLGYSHPSWEERLTFIDQEKMALWRSMMAFKTGVAMLATEQYAVAANLFRSVIAAFPESYEAHANLGYAQLMDYMDQLEPADIEAFGIGQVVVGAFTRRPRSMEPAVRGINTALWFQAATALQTALRLNPSMAEAKANLGLAFLLQPQGSDNAQARQLLAEAVALARNDNGMDNRTKAAIYINAGVAELAVGLIQESYDYLVSAETEINMISGFAGSPDRVVRGELEASLYYNTALILTGLNDAEASSDAADYFNAYLAGTSPSSNWWQIAYNKYVAVCNDIGREPYPVEVYEANHVSSYRTLSGFTFPNGVQVTLGQPLDEFLNQMASSGGDSATYIELSLIENTNLVDYVFHVIETSVFATQEVISVQLYGTAAPSIEVRETGLGTEVHNLWVGMSIYDIDRMLGSDYEKRLLVNWDDGYRFYRDLGLAVRVVNDTVSELVITQIPYDHYWEPVME